MKKKRCNHIKDEYMPIPEGYSKKDFQKTQRGGIDAFTQTRIKDFISYFCATNIPDNEAIFLIQKQFDVKLSRPSYYKMKNEVMSNVEVQTWLNSYAKIGFVAAHIQDIERTKMMTDRIVSAFLTEISKDHEERNYPMISQLTRDYEKLAKLSIVLRAGAPILARIKAMIDASNIRALENDPNMTDEERQEILSRRGAKAQNVITVPNTLTDDPTDLTVVTRGVSDKKNENPEERGKAVKYNPQLGIERPELDKEESKHFKEYTENESTPEEKQELKEDLEFYKKHTPTTSQKSEQPKSEYIPGSQSGSEFIRFLIQESKSDDIIPKRYKSGLNLDTEG